MFLQEADEGGGNVRQSCQCDEEQRSVDARNCGWQAACRSPGEQAGTNRSTGDLAVTSSRYRAGCVTVVSRAWIKVWDDEGEDVGDGGGMKRRSWGDLLVGGDPMMQVRGTC